MSTSPVHLENDGFVHGRSPAMQRLNALVQEIAPTNIPVLLVGESGTGKDVYGRLIHRLSHHVHMAFKKLSCTALQPGEFLARLESDVREKNGDSENGLGALFLDGIDELDLACQRVLVSFLSEGEIDENRYGPMRLISAASRDLEKEIESGRFRRELYFRISGVCLRLPPLRERREDVLPLMEHFLWKYSAETGREIPVLNYKEMEFLTKHNWPGNVRELENLARKMVVLGDGREAIDELREMPKLEATLEKVHSFSLKVAARAASRQAERELIAKALERTHWNRKQAARELQISYKSLLYKIKQTGLEGKPRGTGVKEPQ